MKTPEPFVKSADRVFDVLELAASHPAGLTHAQISQSLTIPKGSLTHLLRNMVGRGYLELHQGGKVFKLGPTVARLASLAGQSRTLVDIGRSYIDRLTALTDESSSLNLLKDNHAERVYGVNSSKALLYRLRIGDLLPLYATSAGKIFLAFGEEAWRQAYLAATPFVQWTPRTLSPDRLRAELPRIVKQRLAVSREEFTVGITGLSRPVLSPDGRAIAAINISVPTVRLTPELSATLADEIGKTASAIAEAYSTA